MKKTKEDLRNLLERIYWMATNQEFGLFATISDNVLTLCFFPSLCARHSRYMLRKCLDEYKNKEIQLDSDTWTMLDAGGDINEPYKPLIIDDDYEYLTDNSTVIINISLNFYEDMTKAHINRMLEYVNALYKKAS
jgi:hypothetical protein